MDTISSLKRQLIFSAVLFVTIIVIVFVALRYIIVRPITCTPNCIGENLLGRELQGLNLAGTNFVEANLQNVNLSEANLRQVDLSGANLVGANLRNADLSEAQLIGTDLTGADLGGTLLSGANLAGAILDQADLTAVDLSQVVLKGASFNGAKLTNVNLTGANLSGIGFAGANLSGAKLDNAELSGALISSADLSGASLTQADLTGAWLNLANLTGAQLARADLSGSQLIGAELTSANLAGSQLRGAVVIGATLNGADVRSADLRQLRALATQVRQEDFSIDPVLRALNELQREALYRDVTLQGLAYDAFTQWEVALQPPDVVAMQARDAQTVINAGPVDETQEGTVDGPLSAQHIKLNFYLNALRNVPGKPGAFDLDFYIDSFWEEPDFSKDQLTLPETKTFFDPVLEIVNGVETKEWGRQYNTSVEPGTNLRLRQRMTAIVTPNLDLRRFPFDRQVVSVQVESAEFDNETLLLDFLGLIEPIVQSEVPYVQSAPRGRYVNASGVTPEWRVEEVTIVQLIRVLPYDNSAWSQFRVDITVKRVATGYIWRIWVVLGCLWLLVGSALLIDSSALHVRLRLLLLLFGILVAFQAIVTTVLPPVNAFTLLDIYLLICYISVVFMTLLVLAIKLLHITGRSRLAKLMNRVAVVGYPTFFALGNLWLLWNALR